MFFRLLPYYLISALALHSVTWYIYGGFNRTDHPPLWDIEEFFAAAGLKFLIFALLTAILYRIYFRLRPLVNSVWWLIIPGLLLFVFCSAWLEDQLLDRLGWVRVFGGRSQLILHFLAALFGALQIAVIAYFKAVDVTKKNLKTELPPEESVKLLLKKNNFEYLVSVDELSYAEAFGNFTKVMVEGETYLYGKGIGKLMEALPESSFLRIHRSYLIRINKVARVRKKSKAVTVILEDGTELPVGPSKKERVLSL